VTRWLALFAVLAACGDGIGVPDATVTPDVMRGLVTVEVRSRFVGSGARVFVQRAGSELVIATATDANGRVQAYVPEHSFVTVVLVHSDDLGVRHFVYTQADVNPGDQVVIDDGTLASTAAISVRIPAGGPDFGSYQAFVPCVATPNLLVPDQPSSVELTGCTSSGTLVVRSSFESFAYVHDASFAPGSLVSLTGETYEPYVDIPLRVTNVPPAITNVRARQTLLDGDRELWIDQLQDGFLFFDGFETSAETTLRGPTWPDARVITKLTTDTFTAGVPSVFEWGPRGEPTTIDFGADALREYQTVPRYVPEANAIGWIEGDRGRLPDAVLAELSWFFSDEQRSASIYWRVFARRGEDARLTLPVLPDVMFQPTGFLDARVTNIGIEGGYDRLRELPVLGRFRDPLFRNELFENPGPTSWPIDAPAGRVVFMSSRNGGGPEF
jgi:hypothetical protein